MVPLLDAEISGDGYLQKGMQSHPTPHKDPKMFCQLIWLITITLLEQFHCVQLLASKPASPYEWLFVHIIAGSGPQRLPASIADY